MKKKNRLILFIIAVITLSVSFTACKKNDDPPNVREELYSIIEKNSKTVQHTEDAGTPSEIITEDKNIEVSTDERESQSLNLQTNLSSDTEKELETEKETQSSETSKKEIVTSLETVKDTDHFKKYITDSQKNLDQMVAAGIYKKATVEAKSDNTAVYKYYLNDSNGFDVEKQKQALDESKSQLDSSVSVELENLHDNYGIENPSLVFEYYSPDGTLITNYKYD